MKADTGNYNANMAAAIRIAKNFREENLSLGGVVKNMTRSFTGYAAGLMSIGAVAGKLHDTVTEAIQLAKSAEGVRLAFSRLNDPSILDGLRQATHGTVTDVELMKAAVKFNDFKLPLDQLGTMLAFAQQKAKDTGESVDFMVESITNGLGRQSKPILDNLGISAKEIEERMKSTGDFTKAVGDIIREQMAKAGDYVETAAERATKADVDLKNAMDDLGRTLMPLQEAGVSMFNSWQIAAVKFLNSALKPVIEAFTTIGRMNKAYGMMGGDSAVDAQIKALAGAGNQRETYFRQMNTYRATNLGLNRAIGAIQAWQGGDRSDAARRAMENAKQTYGLTSLNTAPLRAALDANMKMMEEYKKKALAILEPVKDAITDPTKGDGKGSKAKKIKAKKIKAEDILPVGSVAQLNKEMQQLRDEQSKVTNVSDWRDYEEKIKNVNNRIKELKGELGIEALRGMKGVSVSDGVQLTRKSILKKGDAAIRNFKTQDKPQEVKLTDIMSQVNGGISSMASGIEQLGFELPQGMKDVLGGIQAVTSILTGISTVISTISTLQTIGIFKLAGGGVVKAAGGYRVPGRTFSGDMIPARLNAGELVLNQAQAGIIASALQDRDFSGGMGGQPYTNGENIILGINNTYKRKGMGEVVTTSMLRRMGLMN